MPRKPIAQLSFSRIYPLLVQKAERKGRTREEVDTVTCWLTDTTATASSAKSRATLPTRLSLMKLHA